MKCGMILSQIGPLVADQFRRAASVAVEQVRERAAVIGAEGHEEGEDGRR